MPLADYFVAPSDEVAATAADHGLLELSAEDVAAAKALYRSSPQEASRTRVEAARSGTLLVQSKLSPIFELGRLEEIRTGRPFADVEADPRWASKIAPDQPEDVVVLAVTDTLRDALANLAPASTLEVAARWADTEELLGAEPAGLAEFLGALSELVVRGAGQRLYCRLSL